MQYPAGLRICQHRCLLQRNIEIQIVNPKLRTFGLPRYATAGSAGVDLVACVELPVELVAGGQVLLGTGLAINLGDAGLVGILASRSGLALRHQVRVGQGIGVIDSDYRGEIMVMLRNDGGEAYWVAPGERIAQLLFMPVEQVVLCEVDEFSSASVRGAGGFGHTGRY